MHTYPAGKHETKMILFGAEAVNTRCNYYLKKRLYTEIIKHLLVFFHRSFFECVCGGNVCKYMPVRGIEIDSMRNRMR